MWLVVLMSLAMASEVASLPTLEGRHPLLPPTSCYAFGPQAVMEILRLKVDIINAEVRNKYRKILKYLASTPTLLDDYYLGGSELAMEHGDAIAQLDDSLRRRLDDLRLDVLLPWAHLVYLQEQADIRGPGQAANRRALYRNLRLTLNETESTEQMVLDNISGLVEEFRRLYLGYKKIMGDWIELVWPSNTAEQKRITLYDVLRNDFPMMVGKPLHYFFEDKNMDFYYPHPCGYEEIFGMFSKLRSVMSKLESIPDGDAKWKLLLEQLPKGDINPEEPQPMTQTQIEIEEDELSTHIIDMFTGYPRQKSKKY